MSGLTRLLWRLLPRDEPAPADDAASVAEHVRAFEESIRGTERAYQSTSLLAMSRADTVARALEVLCHGDSRQLAELLQSMAHESYMAASIGAPRLDVKRATELSSIVTALLAHDAVGGLKVPRNPEKAATAILACARRWIEEGSGNHPNLHRIAQLTGGGPGVRAALIAPLGPTAAVLRCVARAWLANFHFRGVATAAAA